MKLTNKASTATATTATASAGTTVTLVPIERLVAHPDVPNRELDEEFVKELSLDIANNGLDVPIAIWDGNGTKVRVGGQEYDGTFVVAGRHRREAIAQLRKRDKATFQKLFSQGVPCISRQGALVDVLALQLRENVQRKDMSSADILPFMVTLRDAHKLTGKDIASKIGKSRAWVSRIFEIEAELGTEGVAEVSKGGVSMREATKIAKKAKSAKSKGEKLDVKEEVSKVKADKGDRERAVKRDSLKTLFKRYQGLPSTTLGLRVEILENLIQYVLQDIDELPEQLVVKDDPATPAKAPKKSKKA